MREVVPQGDVPKKKRKKRKQRSTTPLVQKPWKLSLTTLVWVPVLTPLAQVRLTPPHLAPLLQVLLWCLPRVPPVLHFMLPPLLVILQLLLVPLMLLVLLLTIATIVPVTRRKGMQHWKSTTGFKRSMTHFSRNTLSCRMDRCVNCGSQNSCWSSLVFTGHT